MSDAVLQQKAEEFVTTLLAAGMSHAIGQTKNDELLHRLEQHLEGRSLLARGAAPGAYFIRNVVNGSPVLLNGYTEPAFLSLEFARACLQVLKGKNESGAGIFQLVEKV